MISKISISDYSYDLDEGRIAKYPLPERDSSKLLVYRDGTVSESVFRNLPSVLAAQLHAVETPAANPVETPAHPIMIFNDTKVVPARLHFRRSSGAHIEIFCLEPVAPAEYVSAFAAVGSCRWKCVVGNAKRWKDDVLDFFNPEGAQNVSEMALKAKLIDREGQTATVEFSWETPVPFSQVLDTCGRVPIPPYLNRDTEAIDLERYQTLYARYRGSVAAPTAGLHFTDRVLQGIRDEGIDMENVCLHVGAGTFLPVKTDDVSEHPMHREAIVIKLPLLRKLAAPHGPVISVGTTSIRTLESLYYLGVSCIEKGAPEPVGQWAPYEREYPYTTSGALQALVAWLEARGEQELRTSTRIIIVPGFRFRIADMLVTNFHQSESTLLLLVSAFVGGDWRTIYDYALAHDFRFLSYGDSSLLVRADK